MKKYKVIHFDGLDGWAGAGKFKPEKLQEVLNSESQNGWELFSNTPMGKAGGQLTALILVFVKEHDK